MDEAAADRLATLIESSDLAGLVRLVDAEARDRRWEALVDIAERCREAVERGKQVWAIAHYAEYRLALEAPAAYAGAVVGDGGAGLSLGPLWEVAATTHTWDDLEPHLGAPASRALVAHERVLHGEAVDPSTIDPRVVDLPLSVMSWEPAYATAVYRVDGADFPQNPGPSLEWVTLPPSGRPAEEDDAVHALLDLVRPWSDESSGRAVAVAVEGNALEAVAALGPRRARVSEATLEQALAAMAWAGASGGAFGRRRGGPVGRSGAWWVLTALLGYDEPPTEREWGTEGRDLEWVLWDPGDQVGGWSLHLAIADPDDGLAWAMSAVDMR